MEQLLLKSVSAETAERTIVKPKTLNELLHALCLIDEAMLEVDLNAAPDLMDQGKVKIDSYKYLIDRMETMQEEMKRKKQEYAKAEETLKNQCKRLKDQLIYAMTINGFEKFSGNEYRCWVQYSESVELKYSEPGAQHKLQFPNLIKTSYEWKLKPIKDLLKTDIQTLQSESDKAMAVKVREFASIARKPGIRFSVMKEI